jgi:prepilin-type N-terminal cleavage/methylation domain-containing protein
MRKRGFTLVELLVVIAIIAILAAMIMPVLMEAKDAARMKGCVSNLRQLGSCLQMYFDDHNGFGLPIDPDANSRHAYVNGWVLHVKPLQKYVGQPLVLPQPDGMTGYQQPNRVWICSGDICYGKGLNDRPVWWNFGSSYLYPGPTAYIAPSPDAPNDCMTKDPRAVPLRPSTWRCPRRDMLLSDYWFDFHGGYRVPKDYTSSQPQLFWAQLSEKPRNESRCMNVLFLDLHAAAVTPSERDALITNVRIVDNPECPQPNLVP